jgi:hypothetical protein
LFKFKGSTGLRQLDSFVLPRTASIKRTAALNTPIGVVDISWLEAAAGFHDLSPNPDDYVFSIQRAVVADIPNRNGDCFSRQELHRFNHSNASPVWGTFNRKPVYFEHNQVPKDARGLIFKSFVDVEGPYQFVTTLTGVDRRKDSSLAQAVKNNTRPYWSMGCIAEYVTCSIPSCRRKATTSKEFCTHIQNQLGQVIGDNLCYEILGEVGFIEISSVSDPAALIAGNGTFDMVDGMAVPTR